MPVGFPFSHAWPALDGIGVGFQHLTVGRPFTRNIAVKLAMTRVSVYENLPAFSFGADTHCSCINHSRYKRGGYHNVDCIGNSWQWVSTLSSPLPRTNGRGGAAARVKRKDQNEADNFYLPVGRLCDGAGSGKHSQISQ